MSKARVGAAANPRALVLARRLDARAQAGASGLYLRGPGFAVLANRDATAWVDLAQERARAAVATLTDAEIADGYEFAGLTGCHIEDKIRSCGDGLYAELLADVGSPAPT